MAPPLLEPAAMDKVSFGHEQVSPEEKEVLEKLGDSQNFQPKPDKNEKSFFDKVKEMFS